MVLYREYMVSLYERVRRITEFIERWDREFFEARNSVEGDYDASKNGRVTQVIKVHVSEETEKDFPLERNTFLTGGGQWCQACCFFRNSSSFI